MKMLRKGQVSQSRSCRSASESELAVKKVEKGAFYNGYRKLHQPLP